MLVGRQAKTSRCRAGMVEPQAVGGWRAGMHLVAVVAPVRRSVHCGQMLAVGGGSRFAGGIVASRASLSLQL